jgi:hypothetical protein
MDVFRFTSGSGTLSKLGLLRYWQQYQGIRFEYQGMCIVFIYLNPHNRSVVQNERFKKNSKQGQCNVNNETDEASTSRIKYRLQK